MGARPPPASHLAFERLHGQVDDHVRLERLLLDEALEADVTLEGPDAVVDQHVSLQVGRERELPRTHVALVAFHPLEKEERKETALQSTVWSPVHNCPACGKTAGLKPNTEPSGKLLAWQWQLSVPL